jgi:Ca2+-binding RTX toxin-like protein
MPLSLPLQLSSRVLRPLLGLALVCGLTASFAAPAFAKPVVADLRVLTPTVTLERGASYVNDTASIRTDPNAKCFPGAAGGSGNVVKLPGPTALGIVRFAEEVNARLRPISVDDEFGFGLGICGFGGYEAQFPNSTWYLKVNHKETTAGGDQVRLHNGDHVLWYLAPNNYPNPAPTELELRGPARAVPGPVTVTVIGHSCVTDSTTFETTCTAAPADGATVGGVTTGPDGKATLTLAEPGATLIATRGADIPSNRLGVCVNAQLSKCAARRGKRIIGTRGRDTIHGTKGPDVIRGRGRDDEIFVGGGAADKVDCGSGEDTVHAGVNDILRSCEVVIRH